MCAKPDVLFFGLGAIGSTYAYIFQESKRARVSVVARSNYGLAKEKGLSLRSKKFGDHDGIKFHGVYRDTAEAAASGNKFAFVICTNKALLDATPSLASQLEPVVSPDTTIVLVQNGVGAEEPLHQAFPNHTIISCVCWTGAKALEVGVVEQFNRDAMTVGVDWNPSLKREDEAKRLEEFAAILRAGKTECDVKEDIQSERWVKVIWNACWNSLTTVTQLRTNRFLSSSPHSLPLAYAVMNEVAAVATAQGLHVPVGTVEKLIEQCTRVKEGLPSSMLMDHLEGRPMEVEVILGTPLRKGLELGVPVPILATLYSIVKALDWKNAHPDEARI